jgi:hypothetical protein
VPLRIGVDARELQGRPTGTGRYLRSLLRVWSRSADAAWVLYFNGPAPSDPALAAASFQLRPLGASPTRGLVWQEWRLPRAAARDRLDVFFSPAYVCPLAWPTGRSARTPTCRRRLLATRRGGDSAWTVRCC